ncbi:MAG: radical SAM protein [Anaerolineales bacterium]|nr:MAG: radical SAM protein [Anaerolineales bacterium]
MSNLINSFRNIFSTVEQISPGIYHYQAPPDDPRNYRLHLRVEADGVGILIINASTVLHLNETATEYAFYFVKNLPLEDVIRKMTQRYRVDPQQAKNDYLDFTDRLLTIIEMPDLDPVTFLDFSRQQPYSSQISAPYRLDCAITYQLPPSADPSAAPTKSVTRELSTKEWVSILEKAWQAGIPHVIFTGGEPTLREDLSELIATAEKLGQVSGLLTDGYRFQDKVYLDRLLQTGLDHLMILLHPDDEKSWDAVQIPLPEDIYVAVHHTVTGENLEQEKSIIDRLATIDINAVSLSINDSVLKDTLYKLTTYAASQGLSLVWDIPVPYSSLNPVNLEIPNNELVEGAGRAWLYVEPDGDVLPAQGANQILGNLVNDSWGQVWSSTKNKVRTSEVS